MRSIEQRYWILKHPITTKGDTIYYNGTLVGAKLAKRHLKQGKYILMNMGMPPRLTDCHKAKLAEMKLQLLNAGGCTAEGYLTTQSHGLQQGRHRLFQAI